MCLVSGCLCDPRSDCFFVFKRKTSYEMRISDWSSDGCSSDLIRTDIIGEQWEDVLRLVGSIKAGHVAPSVMLRKLAAYERQNQLDVALQEIGKIERTLFMLDWLENPDLRRRCHAGLNNSEQRHALTQAIYTFRQGRIIDRSHEAQQYRASGLNLLVAAIVYWNTIYMDAAAQHLRSTSVAVPDDLLAHTPPGGVEPIVLGRRCWRERVWVYV